MSKFNAYKCDGCGKVEKARTVTKKSRYSGYSFKEETYPTGWQPLSVPGKRGHVCSEACVDLFAENAVQKGLDAARQAFAKKKAPKGKAKASV